MQGRLGSMKPENLILDASDGVLTITFNRPQSLNAMTQQTHEELEAVFNMFAANDSLQVAIVTGAGRAFCAGSDLKSFTLDNAPPYPPHGYAGLIQRHDLLKPVIAAVNGLAFGGGFEFALACDIIVADENASFCLAEPKVDLIAIAGGITRLVRTVGLKRAMIPLLTARSIPARKGYDLGFVSEVVGDGEALIRARELAAEIMACAPLAVRATKDIAYRGLDEPTLADALKVQATYASFETWRKSDDAREGMEAFIEKRPPVWRGR